MRTAFPHQQELIEFVQARSRGALFVDAGLGKTLSILRGLDVANTKAKTLVICPASLRMNWAEECRLEKCICDIESYAWLAKQVKEVQSDIRNPIIQQKKIREIFGKYDNLIFDESLYLKNIEAKRTSSAIKVSNCIKNVWFLTGTPLATCSSDIFATMSICQPGEWGTYKEFCDRYCEVEYDPFKKRKVYKGFKNTDELRERVKGCAIRMKKYDVLDSLPEKIEAVTYVPGMPVKCEESLELIWKNRMSEHISHMRQDTAISKMSGYIDSLRARNIESGIIFVYHREVGHLLSKKLKAEFIYSGVDMETRYEMIERFQLSKKNWLVISIKAGGVGLNIQRAGYVGFMELPWEAASVDQCLSRALRIGNENRSVLIEYPLLPDSIDIPIYKLVMNRKEQSQRVTG